MPINKKDVLGLIDKYELGGITNSAIWELKDDKITIPFRVAEHGLLGSINYNANPFGENFEFGIMNSKQLRGMVAIMGDEFDFKLNENTHQIKMKDESLNATFVLSPIDLMGDKPALKKEADYMYLVELTDDLKANIFRAIKGIGEEYLTFVREDGVDKIVVGYDRNNSNRVEVKLNIENDIDYNPITFKTSALIPIIDKNSDSEIDIEVSTAMLRINCTSDQYESTYWVKKYGN